ncbi:uncharacterized protein LOC142597355 [Dermatophagoides farinae]|uniref:Uncharacterized protein n=1 Tax=Dermatophagoides farinae TaxID=6954 RepID=A0A9D4SCU8_DERFA|nr:hypothetical protein HUG17_7114 [Dermatophagoides farinae]
MTRKRKSKDEHHWKPVAIECDDGLTAEDFQGLVSIEELDNYQIVRAEPSKPDDDRKSEKETKHKVKNIKKKKLIKNVNSFVVSKQEDEVEFKSDGEDDVKLKRNNV